jgi:hypothetical protein
VLGTEWEEAVGKAVCKGADLGVTTPALWTLLWTEKKLEEDVG